MISERAAQARRRVAEAMIERGSSTAPIGHWAEGLARVAQALYGGYRLAREEAREREMEKSARDIALSHPALGGASYGGTAPASDGVAKSLGPGALDPLPIGGQSNLDKVYSNDEPSPLDPPSGADKDMMVRTVLAEAGNQSPTGQLAVANVIRKRAIDGRYGGDTIPGVVTARSQFEPWNTTEGRAKMAAIDPNSAQYRLAAALVDRAYTGVDDPTGGATHFYAPKAQAALGRPVPTWDNGRGVDIGDHRFFGGQPAVNVAQAPGGPQMPPAVADYVKRALANPRTRAMGLQLLQQYSKPSDSDLQVIGQGPDGPQYGWVDKRTRTVTPYTAPVAPLPTDSVVPPAPPGVDPKIWRKEQSERKTREGMPASFEDATKLRREVQDLPSYKNLAQAAPVYKSMVEAAGRDTRAADVNLIYGMAKIMDPTSVVRESEMTVAQAVATLPEYLRANIQSQLTSAGRLDLNVRAAIMQEARSRIMAYQGMFDQDAGFYRGVSERNRMNAVDIIPSFGEFPEWKAPAVTGETILSPAPTVPAGKLRWDPHKGLVPQ
jgi:hypothetical protein